MKSIIWRLACHRATIFSVLYSARDPLSTHRKTFLDLGPAGREGPRPNFRKFDSDIFPGIKTSYKFLERQRVVPSTFPENLKKF